MKGKSERIPLYTVYGPKMLEDMTWAEVADALKETDIALPIVGSVENHGPHSPLRSDSIQGVEIAQRAALKLASKGIKSVVGPLIPFGYATHHMGFPGTITLRAATLHNLIKDVVRCLIQHGFRNIAVLNGHGGNLASIYLAVDEIYEETKKEVKNLRIAAPDWFPTMYETYAKVAKDKEPERDFHQGERETSFTLAAVPELVNMKKAGKYYSEELDRKKALYGWSVNIPYYVDYDMKATTPVGFIGDATLASKEVGEALYEATSQFIADFVYNEFTRRRK
jgi:creatinine amidohydrolase